jgi:hypothetical protein
MEHPMSSNPSTPSAKINVDALDLSGFRIEASVLLEYLRAHRRPGLELEDLKQLYDDTKKAVARLSAVASRLGLSTVCAGQCLLEGDHQKRQAVEAIVLIVQTLQLTLPSGANGQPWWSGHIRDLETAINMLPVPLSQAELSGLTAKIQTEVSYLEAPERRRLVTIVDDFAGWLEEVYKIKTGAAALNTWALTTSNLKAPFRKLTALVTVPPWLERIVNEGPGAEYAGYLGPAGAAYWRSEVIQRMDLAREFLKLLRVAAAHGALQVDDDYIAALSGNTQRKLLRAVNGKGTVPIADVLRAVYGSTDPARLDGLLRAKDRVNIRLAEDNKRYELRRKGETLILSPL